MFFVGWVFFRGGGGGGGWGKAHAELLKNDYNKNVKCSLIANQIRMISFLDLSSSPCPVTSIARVVLLDLALDRKVWLCFLSFSLSFFLPSFLPFYLSVFLCFFVPFIKQELYG